MCVSMLSRTALEYIVATNVYRNITTIQLMSASSQQAIYHKKAVLSQRLPRNASYIWVP